MTSKKILIISDDAADFSSLGAALDRAEDDRFQYVTANTRDQPIDSLMQASNDAVILAYTPEAVYLLRLAEKKDLLLPRPTPTTAPNIIATSGDAGGPNPPVTAEPINSSSRDSWFINLASFNNRSDAQDFADGLGPASHSVEL